MEEREEAEAPAKGWRLQLFRGIAFLEASLHLKASCALFSTVHRILGLEGILKLPRLIDEGSSPEKASD